MDNTKVIRGEKCEQCEKEVFSSFYTEVGKVLCLSCWEVFEAEKKGKVCPLLPIN